jgi:pimeloyl-ACP methyl ester carboxylesterase
LGALPYVSDEAWARFHELAAMVRDSPAAASAVWTEASFEPGFLDGNRRAAEHWAKYVDAQNWPELARYLEAFTEIPDLRPMAHRITVPVLLRTGNNDLATPISLARELAMLLPNATLDSVPGRRHFLLVDDQSATLNRITG